MSRARWYALSTRVVNIATTPDDPDRAHASSSRFGAPATATTPNAIATRTSADPRSGCSRTRPTGTSVTTPGQHQVPSRRRLVAVPPLREDHRQPDAQRDLDELRRLHREATGQLDPRARPVHGRPDGAQHEDQSGQRHEVDPRRPGPQRPVVDPGDEDEADQPDAEVDERLEQVLRTRGMPRRRPHEQRTDPGQPQAGDDDAPVGPCPHRPAVDSPEDAHRSRAEVRTGRWC